MKKINKLFTVLLFAAFSVISCKNNFSELLNEAEYTNEKAYLSFGINESEERMVAPVVLPWEEVASIELTKDGSELKTWTSYAQMQADTSVVIDAGTYTFAVTLKDKDGDILQTGELKDVEIKGGNNLLNFKTKAWLEGKGRLSVKCYVDDPQTVNTIKVYLNDEEKLSISKESDNSGQYFHDSPICKGNDFDCGNYLITIFINEDKVITDFIEIQNKRETVYNYHYDEKPVVYPVEFKFENGTKIEFKNSDFNVSYTTGMDLPSVTDIANLVEGNISVGSSFWGWYWEDKRITKFPENPEGKVIITAKYGTVITSATDIPSGTATFMAIPANTEDWNAIYSAINGDADKTVILDLSKTSITEITENAFYHNFEPKLQEIIIPASVEKISDSAFYGCKQLESVTFAEGSKLEILDGSAFNGCSSLKEIVIPKGVAVFSGSTFKNCSSLKKVTFEEGSALKTMLGTEFAGCTSLEEIVIPASVEQIGYNTFDGCTKLKKVTFENDSALKAFEGEVFKGCSSLEEISIPASVTDFGKVDGKDVEGSLFTNCTKLKKVTFEGNLITEIPNYTFENCESLEEITIPSSVTQIWAAFTESINLKNVIFSSDSEIEYIDSFAFYGCPDVKITIPSSLATKDCFANKLESDKYKFKLIVNGNITKKSAFEKNKGIVEIEILKNVTSISQYAFQYCQNLKKVSFEEGSKLKRIDNGIFYQCDKLEEIVIPASVTTIGDSAFSLCISLKEIVIPESVTSIENSAFNGCKSLSKVTFEENSKLTIISDGLFYVCEKLTGIVLPATITTIEKDAFGQCRNLQKIDIPASVTKIDGYAFADCGNLSIKYLGGTSNITFGDKVFNHTTVTELPLNE